MERMSLRDILVDVLQHYPQAREQDFTGHPLAARIRQEGKAELEAAAGSAGAGLLARGSAGQSEWAEVPWLALFDPLVTDGAQRGYYVVYLLHSSQPVVHLSVNQGTTAVRTEFGGRAREVLADRAAFIRTRIADFVPELPVTSIDLGSTARLPGDYVAGHAMGVSYELASLPEEQQLRTDLQKAISAYRALTFRGGLDMEPDDEEEEMPPSVAGSLVEKRRYRLHLRIERAVGASRKAKKYHGTRCQGCDTKLSERYGPVAAGLIEAHHLRPISSLEEGVPVTYNVATDFAVLCPNCHRIIHRMPDPSDLAALRGLVLSTTPA
jgi:5-methylcytosine-specific restriction protein A